VYKGIEVKLNAYGDNVEKLFCVKPGAAPEDITIQIEGADTLKVNEEGLLVAETVLGDIQFTKPVAYQDIDGGKILVAAKYRLIEKSAATHEAGPVYGFEIGEYDKTRELVIDPLLSSTYLGGAKGDYGASMVLDAEGNVYVTGWTKSSDFPKTTGIYDKSYGGGDGDAFVSKLSGDLTSLLASTFLGGTFLDSGNAITLDSEGNVYVTGTTYSKDFPTTTDAYNNAYNNKGDAFVAKLNGSLTSLLAATYLGDEENDEGNSITISSDGSVYVTGVTFSSDFPASADAYDNFYDGDGDAFVSKMNGDLTNLLASTFFGGGLADFGSSVFIGQDGSVYVGGKTSSSTFPVTDAYDSTYNGGDADAFISKMDEDLSTLVAFTYIGGSSTDYGNKATIDSDGNIYIAGWTVSSNFPTTAGAYGGSFGGGEGDAFVSKLDGDLKSLLASTYLGGSADDNCYSVAVDSSGNIYAAGLTVSSDFPTTTGAYNTSFGGGDGDVFVSKLDENLGSLSASTYLGGTALDYGNSVAVSSDGSVYVTGFAGSSDFPTARGSYDTSSNGSDDIFISKLDSGLSVDVEAEGTSLVGYVVDKKSKPVTSAKVTLKGTLDPTKEETTTDSAGFFEFADLEADTYKIEISKKGYKKYKESIDLEEGTTEELEITLKKAK
jgi:hypothetical protein